MSLIIFPNQLYTKKYIPKNITKIVIYEHPHYFTKYKYNQLKLILHRASMKYYYDYLTQDYTTIYINYDDEFIQRITVHKEKEEKSDVDKREDARYSSSIEISEVDQNFDKMMGKCKEAISQCEEIVFSDKKFNIPEEFLEKIK